MSESTTTTCDNCKKKRRTRRPYMRVENWLKVFGAAKGSDFCSIECLREWAKTAEIYVPEEK